MSTTYFFTKERLQNLSMKDLKTLANYYGISFSKNIAKQNMVELIFVQQKNFISTMGGITTFEEPNMSVRIRRIKESTEGA